MFKSLIILILFGFSGNMLIIAGLSNVIQLPYHRLIFFVCFFVWGWSLTNQAYGHVRLRKHWVIFATINHRSMFAVQNSHTPHLRQISISVEITDRTLPLRLDLQF